MDQSQASSSKDEQESFAKSNDMTKVGALSGNENEQAANANSQIPDVLGQLSEVVQKGVLDHFLSVNKQIFENVQSLEWIVKLLSDAPSRQQFVKEILYLTMNSFPASYADQFSPFDSEDMSKHFQMLPQYMDQLPVLQVPEEIQNLLNLTYVETFLLEQYRYQDLVKVEPGEIFFDCGAFIGDTALWAYKNGAAAVYNFEPGSMNLEYLRKNLENNNYPSDKCYPYAVGNTNGTVRFLTGESVGSSSQILDSNVGKSIYYTLANDQTKKTAVEEVECIRLDDWCQEHNVYPTFIKMDIEGAETDALTGGENIIKTYKPKLAICLYHRVEDMWTIPALLHSWVPEYRFYCRKNNVPNEFVLYAVV